MIYLLIKTKNLTQMIQSQNNLLYFNVLLYVFFLFHQDEFTKVFTNNIFKLNKHGLFTVISY